MLFPATGLQLLNHLSNTLFIVFICNECCVWCVDDNRILQAERDDQVILACMDDRARCFQTDMFTHNGIAMVVGTNGSSE